MSLAVGAMIGLLAVGFNAALNPFLLAVAAGTMIFVSLHELVPMARRYGRIGWFIVGLAPSVAVYRLLAWGILSESSL